MEGGLNGLSRDWRKRDVMVGILRTASQLEANIRYGFYHIPARLLACHPGDVGFIALYQSKKLFHESSSGIRFYGRVKEYKFLSRVEIPEIPIHSDPGEPYCRFQLIRWETLPKVIRPVGAAPGVSMLTTEFLLKKARNFPELYIRTEEHWELYSRLRKAEINTLRNGGSEPIPSASGNTVLVSGHIIGVYTRDGRFEQYDLRDFFYEPYSFLQTMQAIVNGERLPGLV